MTITSTLAESTVWCSSASSVRASVEEFRVGMTTEKWIMLIFITIVQARIILSAVNGFAPNIQITGCRPIETFDRYPLLARFRLAGFAKSLEKKSFRVLRPRV